ncbi:MarR family transcriptional regulator [Roseomonas sp. OT10]|uniref:MarR family winged helix-turn-helix transcriptional regulator n=1 Tax=Roseomonas cutis TaxID=2897332 RepID=UPI001E5C84F1|nr:MarR family transcriptional regulator [Roseomonas sp. OT10]UFN49454.1 MarR family transcriptional regulator [Roseomonas sp. OT10]
MTPPAATRATPAEPIRLGMLEDAIGFHLRLAQEIAFAAFARRVEGLETRPGHFIILVLIGANPGLSQTTLGAASGRDKSTLTAILDALERQGLILRQRPANNRRSYELSLTAAGEAALRELAVHATEHERALDAILDAAGKADLLRALRQIAAVMART